MSGNTSNAGFTIVELLISISITSIMSVSIFAAMTYYFAAVTRNNITVEMTVDSQNLLRTISEELRYGAGVRQTNSISDTNAPSGGWNTNNNSFVIITAVPALDSNRNYITNPVTGSPYLNELVYYRKQNTLYKRTLAQAGATGNTTRTSCPESLASASCPADKKLMDNLNSVSFILFDQDNGLTSTATNARSIKIDLTMERDTFGTPLKLDNSIQTTLRNNF